MVKILCNTQYSHPAVIFFTNEEWSQQRDLNPRPTVYKTVALPLSYAGMLIIQYANNNKLFLFFQYLITCHL